MYNESIMSILAIIQFVVAILLIIAILLQNRSSGIGATFGGGGMDTGYYTRRGFEKFLTQATIVLAIFFMAIAIARILI